MVSTSEDELVDPVMSIRYTKISLEIKRSDAMDVLGKFGCKCQAASNKGEVASREASINVACKSSFLHCYFFFNFFVRRLYVQLLYLLQSYQKPGMKNRYLGV